MTEKVLQYDHSTMRVAQERGWDCGPASVQIVLQALGVDMSEDQLIRELGTDEDGTDTVEQALPVLNRVTRGQYRAQWMPNDPPGRDEEDTLWRNVKNSIDAGYGCVLNFEVPSNNFPRGTRGSVSPQYRGAKVWHYVACMGYADDGPGGKHLWIADPGFPPNGYWMSLHQAATAIPPHAYAYSTVSAPAVAEPQPTVTPQPAVDGSLEEMVRAIYAELLTPRASQSIYATPGEGAIWKLSDMVASIDAMRHEEDVETTARRGNLPALDLIVQVANGRGQRTDPYAVGRARRFVQELDREHPEVLRMYVDAKGAQQ